MDRTVFDLDAAERWWTWMNFLARAILHIIGPFVLIWCVNTLFSTQVPITFKTWLAGFLLMLMIKLTVGIGTRPCPAQSFYDDDSDEEDYETEDEEPEETEAREQIPQRLKAYNEARKERAQEKDRRTKY